MLRRYQWEVQREFLVGRVLITQRELGQDIKVIYSFGMNPLSFYI